MTTNEILNCLDDIHYNVFDEKGDIKLGEK